METINSIYFFRENNKYGFLSNFYLVDFTCTIDIRNVSTEITFCCSEQYFMLMKCLTFDSNNTELINKIIQSKDPKKIKSYGRIVNNYNDALWNEMRFDIMFEALMYKFNDPNLKLKLIDTYPKSLYEANPFDNIWGIGCEANKAIKVNKNNYGSNLLGKCLEMVRDHCLNTQN